MGSCSVTVWGVVCYGIPSASGLEAPTILTETAQEYCGRRYYLCGSYYQRDGVRLHRLVWQDGTGCDIPDGWHVHHLNEDKADNSPGNLVLMHGSEHTSHHQKGHGRPFSSIAHRMAAVWHGSPSGRDWHVQHYAEFGHLLHHKAEYTCEQCGKSCVTQVRGNNRFCTNNCKSAWRRAARLDHVERVCIVCGGKSPPTSISPPNVAVVNAGHSPPIRCVRLSDENERADVYCLRVPETRAFAVNSGIIVSNCMDASRYLVMSGIDIATPRPQTQWSRQRSLHQISYDPMMELWKKR
jgi:hypothetical protein